MIDKLGMRGAPLASGLVERIGELCAGGDDAAAAGEQAVDDQLLLAAQNALGAAMLSLGPETVLAALPLNLVEGLAGTAEPRTWLLPLLRIHVRSARLGYWGKVLLPLARELGTRAAAAARWVGMLAGLLLTAALATGPALQPPCMHDAPLVAVWQFRPALPRRSYVCLCAPLLCPCSDPAKAREAQICSALEMQLWATLPSFCSWAVDTADAFK